MKSYIVYKNQMQGVKDVSETVKTVEKIAASSVHSLKQEVFNLNFYATELEKVLNRLSPFCREKDHPLLRKKDFGKKTLVIITGDKGLVGGLWHGVINIFLENIDQYKAVVVIGAKGENYLKEEAVPIIKLFTSFFDIPQKEEIANITDYIFDEFKKGVFSRVDILYSQFVSLAEQTPKLTSFLPFEFTSHFLNQSNNMPIPKNKYLDKSSSGGLPIFEPSRQKIFEEILQKYIGVFFYKIVMETKLSEFSARTVAMEHAAAKTDELIQRLMLNYTKERRRIVTQRQLESFAVHKIV